MATQFKRATTIASILSEEGLGFVAARLGLDPSGGDQAAAGNGRDLPASLRRLCERLGPLFVKFGQVLATRRDLVSDEFCEELAKLQASVPPFNGKKAMEIVEGELGRPLSEVFAHVDDLPLAAASLAQVYGAELKDGTSVVLKVRRPEAVEQVAADLDLLLWMSRQLHRLVPQYRAQQLHRLAEEFARDTRRECDFLNEVDAASRFDGFVKGDAVLRVPKVYRALSTSALIVMERFDGRRLDQVQDAAELRALGMPPELLVDTLLRGAVEQAFLHGLIHADLHPGNIFILPGAKVGMIDFGMHGELSKELQGSMARSLLHSASGRYDECVDVLLEVYEHGEGCDEGGFRREMIAVSKKAHNASLRDYSLGQSLVDEGKIAAKFRYVAPPGLLMFARSLLMTEGVALKFTPDVNLSEKLRAHIQRVLLRRFDLSRVLEGLMPLIPDLLQYVENMPKVMRHLLAIDRRFANAKAPSLLDLLGGEATGSSAKAQQASGLGPWLVASVLWAGGGAAAVLPPAAGTPLVGGISWFVAVALPAAVLLTGYLLGKRR